jgi:hypothetical protein
VSPFITHQPSDVLPAGITGFIVLAAGFLLWWPVMRLFIRADEEGITQTTGLFRQSVRWDDVAYYYPEMNRKNDQKQRWHTKPVLLDANGKIIFRDRAYVQASTQKTLRQRAELWEFAEAHLQGKRIDLPSPDLNPKALAWKSLSVNWSEKSRVWVIGRMFALLLYAMCLYVPAFSFSFISTILARSYRPIMSPFLCCLCIVLYAAL